MKELLFGVLIFALAMAFSQVLLKIGVSQISLFKFQGLKDIFGLVLKIFLNPSILLSMALMVSSFFLWLYILSKFKLGVAFPLTAMTYVFVALFSYFMLGEKLTLFNYLGITLIAAGVFFLLYKF